MNNYHDKFLSKTVKVYKQTIAVYLFFFCSITTIVQAQQRAYYTEPTWKPRAVLPYEDAIHDKFWPASPSIKVSYAGEGFDEQRLSTIPAVGEHPRVLITPTDVEKIQAKVALGNNAPIAFKTMWQRVAQLKTPFYALVSNDSVLGRKLAEELVEKLKSLTLKIPEMDKRTDRDNIWAVERSIIADGDPNPPTEIWDLLDYDYLHKWMTPIERELARTVIASIIKKRISNFLMVPDHFMINNHEGFGMEYIRLMLLIEGEPGFDEQLFQLAIKKTNAMLTWYLSKDGMCYESIKGWLNTSAFVAVGLRKRDLLKHEHLMAKMNFFLAATRWENNTWLMRDEMRASSFHVAWMMHYYFPKNERIDFLYQTSFSTHPFLTDASVKWPDPVGICYELLLLFADEGIVLPNGKNIDWNNQVNIDKLNLPLTWHDSTRGYVEIRNSWKKDDLKVGFVCKQDFFYGGHEGSENNRLTLWKDGVNWIQDNNMLATKATFLQNMLTVDGMGCQWPPVAGNWLGIQESKDAVLAVGDGKMGYSFSKVMQVHPLAFPSANLPYYKPFTEGNFDLSRDLQIAYQPSTIRWNHGYAHTDYGPWSGETRLVESYKPFNTMLKAYRTVQVAKGKYPYLLVIDDAQKDNQSHLFEWNISVPIDAELVEAITPEIVFQNTEPAANRMSDLIIAKGPIKRDSATGKAILKKGDPLCLIRVLWRNTNYGFPIPKLEKFQGYSLVTIPAIAVSPEFKVLVYPYKYGDPLPQTVWNKTRTVLNIEIKEQKDEYHFSNTDGGRTVFQMQRNAKPTINSAATPTQPVLIIRNQEYNSSDFRYTRQENKTPVYLINNQTTLQFKYPEAPAEIRYTLDGTEPTITSTIYNQPIIIQKSLVVKAKTFYTNWKFGNSNASITTIAQFIVKKLPQAIANLPALSKNGLSVQLFEINTKLYDDKGFFDSAKIMLPNLSSYKSSYTTFVDDFQLPMFTPTKPLAEQVKGFYKFSGYFYAKQNGIYTFHVNSCGPVLLELANQTVVEETGVFHQQQAVRKGEVVLAKGWHALQLTICDPLFWNSNSLPIMPFSVNYQIEGGGLQNISSTDIKSINPSTIAQSSKQWLQPVTNIPMLEPGLEMQLFDRTGKRRDADFLDIDQVQPIVSEQVQTMEAANSRNSVRVYNGYFYAATTGEYQFQMPYRVGANAGLGGTQASCQSQLKVGNTIVLQRGVYGRNLSGKAMLLQGWHKISLRFGTGEASCTVQLPDEQIISLNANNLYRSSLVQIQVNGVATQKQQLEIYDSVTINLVFNKATNAQIRYTLDGSIPNLQSPIFKTNIQVHQTQILTAVAFVQDKAVTAPSIIQFKKVLVPESASMGILQFQQWNGTSSLYPIQAKYKVWISPISKPATGIQGKALQVKAVNSLFSKNVDVNVSRGSTNKPGLKLYEMVMRENALTVAVWFKTNELNGKLFGKDGYNAFGKGYKTISCALNNGNITAMPNRLNGGKIKLNEWQHVVLTASEQKMSLYLNGNLVATADGIKDIMTDALDFFTGINAEIDYVQLFDSFLQADEVKRLYNYRLK